MYCEFEETGQIYKHKKVYKCKICGLVLSLEDPKANILCFSQTRAVLRQTAQDDIDSLANESYEKATEEKTVTTKQNVSDPKLCTEEEISSRLSICEQCEHYQDNVCTLCGCAIVRAKNYQNKLAQTGASCPVGKWGPINT